MMKNQERWKTTYIVSSSSMDLVSVLALYEKYRASNDIVILISATEESLRFLQGLSLPGAKLRFLDFKSEREGNRRFIVRYLRQLLVERRLLNEVIAEIRANAENQLFFHSYDNDPHAGYLVARVSETNPVTLIDVLGIRPKSLGFADLLNAVGLKNAAYLALMTLVFGRLFVLSGTKSYPILSLNLKRVRIASEEPRAKASDPALAPYKHRLSGQGGIAVLLYANAFGVPEHRHASVYRSVVECLISNGFEVHVKMHPQSRWPEFLERYPTARIPKHVPFELVDLRNVALVVGITGAALLCTERVPTISVVKLVYESDSDYYHAAMNQLRQNPAVKFVSSMEEFAKMLENVRSADASPAGIFQGSMHGAA